MIEKIASDLFRIELPLPLSQLQSINSYIIKSAERNLIVDTGMGNNECLAVMQGSLRELDVDITRTDFFVTHYHGDHFGLVPRLVEEDALIYMHRIDADVIHGIRSDTILTDIKDFIQMSGFPQEEIDNIFPPGAADKFKQKAVLPFKILEDNDTLNVGDYRFICVHTPGHSKGHLCLYDIEKKLFIAGDHLLGDITPGIQGRYDNENPLADYVLSLDKVYDLDIDLVLPGHRSTFRNCKQRIKELKAHHEERSQEVISLLKQKSGTAYEIASQMTWNIDCDTWDTAPSMQKFFATGEAFAHLKYLMSKHSITERMEGHVFVYSLMGTQKID